MDSYAVCHGKWWVTKMSVTVSGGGGGVVGANFYPYTLQHSLLDRVSQNNKEVQIFNPRVSPSQKN